MMTISDILQIIVAGVSGAPFTTPDQQYDPAVICKTSLC